MKINKQWLIRLLILLFSVSVSVFSCGVINTYGLFGEIISETVTEDKDSIIFDESQAFKNKKHIRGINIFNEWLEIWICIICFIFYAYVFGLPREDTIVTLKVRIDD